MGTLLKASSAFTVTILGSGTSTGVPVIGCRCAVCTSSEPRNQRTRAALMLTMTAGPHRGEHIVIDTGPDFRTQMLRQGITRLEHVLYTHAHADHCHGFDDLRAFYFHQKTPVHCYVPEIHFDDFRQRFAYAFEDTGYLGTKPQVQLSSIKNGKVFAVLGLEIEPVLVEHGNIMTSVYRIGRFLYATDFKQFTPELRARWRGQVDTVVASGVHFREHPSHSNIYETLALFADLGVKSGVITHLAHDVDYHESAHCLPAHVQFAYDGMTIDGVV